MRYSVKHEIPGRFRAQLAGPVPERDVDALMSILEDCPWVTRAHVYPHIGCISVAYVYSEDNRQDVFERISAIDAIDLAKARDQYNISLAPRSHKLALELVNLITTYVLKRWFLPSPLKLVFTIVGFLPFALEAFQQLLRPKLTVPVLDASAIAASLLQRDMATAGETMFLLNIGEVLEDYTRTASENELIHSLLDVSEQAWLVFKDEEIAVPAGELQPGDVIVIRTGMSIVADGVVERGTAEVNQASLTGESIAISRSVGDTVYAGTAVEDGEIFVRVATRADETRLRSVVHMVEHADSQKAATQSKMEALADSIVPWNFALAAGVALFTRDIVKTSAALMVDYSCALKLTGSVAVMSALSQAARCGIIAKGAKYLEVFSQVDVIVFDKTGTLTDASPQLVSVVSYNADWSEDEVLRLAACLEEHFPHPVARAVVRGAEERNLKHRERHAGVEYIVAHGIVSSLDDKRVVIGSKHFVVEDERVHITKQQEHNIEEVFYGLTPLYLAIDNKLIGVLGIQDPIKPGVKQALQTLSNMGFKRVIMLTGDSFQTAARIAQEAGISEFKADMLPEDKFAFLDALRSQGHTVAMVGDGVNDSPALSRADVGVAMGSGSDIAKEVADIVLTSSDLTGLVQLRTLSQRLVERLNASFTSIMGFNSALLALGIAGVVTPQVSSLLHNASTVALGFANAQPYALDVASSVREVAQDARDKSALPCRTCDAQTCIPLVCNR